MTGAARAAEPGTLFFDTLSPVTSVQIQIFKGRGFKGVGRYLENLTDDEVAEIHGEGLFIVPITEARIIPPSPGAGDDAGALEVDRARSRGIPQGVHLTIDNEAVHGTAEEDAEYIDAFSLRFTRAAYGGMLYVAQPQPLTGPQMYARPNVDRYWSGASRNPEPDCGYTCFQGLPIDYRPPWCPSAQVDLDIIFADRLGRTPVVWCPA